MKNRLLPLFIFLVFGIIFIIFFKGLEDSNIYTPDINIKNDIPVFKSNSLYLNKSLSSSDVFEFDKTYLLNIWSSWCVPCRQEHSLLMELKHHGKMNIIGLNYKDSRKNAINFLNELGNPYKKIFIDPDGIISIEWGAYGVPETFLIHNNKVIKKYIGPLDKKLIDQIKKIIE